MTHGAASGRASGASGGRCWARRSHCKTVCFATKHGSKGSLKYFESRNISFDLTYFTMTRRISEGFIHRFDALPDFVAATYDLGPGRAELRDPTWPGWVSQQGQRSQPLKRPDVSPGPPGPPGPQRTPGRAWPPTGRQSRKPRKPVRFSPSQPGQPPESTRRVSRGSAPAPSKGRRRVPAGAGPGVASDAESEAEAWPRPGVWLAGMRRRSLVGPWSPEPLPETGILTETWPQCRFFAPRGVAFHFHNFARAGTFHSAISQPLFLFPPSRSLAVAWLRLARRGSCSRLSSTHSTPPLSAGPLVLRPEARLATERLPRCRARPPSCRP